MNDHLLGTFGRRALRGYAFLLLLFIMLPILIMVPVSLGKGEALIFPPAALSLEWYSALLRDPRWGRAFSLSLQIALMTSVFATVIGVAAALGISRVEGRNWLRFLKLMFIAPMIVPLMVMGVGFYIVYARLGLLGNSVPLALAHAIVVLPFVIIPVMSRVVSLDPALERAAASLGAGPYYTIWHVILPLLAPAIVASSVFAFIFSFDEVVIAQLLSGPRFETLPRKVWESMALDGLDKSITAISTLQLVVVLACLGAYALWRRFNAARLRRQAAD
jgi:ABC-type spermidine/putrescine transport system permease subunit II